MDEQQFWALMAEKQRAREDALNNSKQERIDAEVQANTMANRGMQTGPVSRGVLEPEARIWGGVGSLGTNDPRALLAERLGKLRGAMEFNKGSLAKGTSGRLSTDMRAQMAALEAALGGYEDDSDLQRQLLQEQIRQMKLSGKSERRATSKRLAMERAQMRGDMSRQYSVSDPYKQLRESAISSARKYLGIDSPHLISSLKLNDLE